MATALPEPPGDPTPHPPVRESGPPPPPRPDDVMAAGATDEADVTVVGAGVIGLSVAWTLARRGMRVRVHDPAPGSGASRVAAGMLAPVGETGTDTAPLVSLLCESADAWPAFAVDLEVASGTTVGYRTEPTLVVAADADGVTELDREAARYTSLRLDARRLRGSAARRAEPLLAPRVRAGLLVDADRQVDPRRVVAALRRLVPVDTSPVPADRPGVVVLAAGWRTGALAGLPVRPVKGQVLRLRATAGAPRLSRVVRGSVDGRGVYLVPRADGEVVVGATSEERGDTTVTAGAVYDLLRAAVELVPALAEYELAETVAGLRPATPDNLPLLGRLDARTVVATGHYRHGILLAPATAAAVAEIVHTGRTPDRLAPFDPLRFQERSRHA